MVVSALAPYIPEPGYITLHEALICSANKQYDIYNYELIQSTSTIDVYKCSLKPSLASPGKMKYIMIVIKTKDICLSSDYWNLFAAFKGNFINLEKYFNGTILQNNNFYENVKSDISSLISVYPKIEYTESESESESKYIYSIVGQGEGGAIIDDLILNNYVNYGMSFNPLIEAKNFKNRHTMLVGSTLYYSDDSPFRKTFGRLIDTANILPWKLKYDNVDSRWIYINNKPILVSNSTDNESFYGGVGLHKWSSVSMTYNGQYQIASTVYGSLYQSYDYGQTWEKKDTPNIYFPSKLTCSKVKFGIIGNRALFLQQNKLYISKTLGSTWELVSDVVIPSEYNTVMGNSCIYMSYDSLILMVFVPAISGISHPLLFTSYDAGLTWIDFYKRRSSIEYNNFKQQVLNYASSHESYAFYNNENDLDLPIPYIHNTPPFKFLLAAVKYLWKPSNSIPSSGVNPIFSFSDTRLASFFNNPNEPSFEEPFRDEEISFTHNFDAITAIVGEGVFGNGTIKYSNDYSQTWNNSSTNGFHSFGSSCVHISGDYQVTVTSTDARNGFAIIRTSIDSGKNWSIVLEKNFKWTSVAISNNGKIITAVCNEMYYPNKNSDIKTKETYIDGGFICISYDGGVTWKERR